MTYMPKTIFSCQTTSKKATFLEFGLKNANLATLVTIAQAYVSVLRNYEKNTRVKSLGKFPRGKPCCKSSTNQSIPEQKLQVDEYLSKVL